MSHTKEPWRTTELDRVISDTMEKLNDDYFIADCFGPDAKQNARRIVACVNACAGKTNEQLEGFAGKIFTGSEIELWTSYCDVKAQRDELLAALMKIRDSLLMANQDKEISKHVKFTWEIDLLLQVIAKCEAQS